MSATDNPTDNPKARQQQNRQHRLGAALRDNLKRRKAQARGRASTVATDGKISVTTHDSAGIGADKRKD